MSPRTSDQEDYLERLIRQAAEALRRLRARLTNDADSPDAVRRDAAIAVQALLGAEAPLLSRLDAASAVRLVGSAQRVTLWCDLLDVEARAAERAGDARTCASLTTRAQSLRAAAAVMWPSDDAIA